MRRSVVALFTLSTLVAHVAVVAAALSVAGCSSAPEGPEALGVPASSESAPVPDGGAQGRTGEPPPPPPAAKADELTEAFGIFVTENGAADAAGTRAAPLASIGAALLKAKAEKKSVFVCEGSYPEALMLESGVSIRGGLDCSGPEWKLTTRQSTLAAPASPAVRASGVALPTRVDNLAIVAPNATSPDADRSSIGVLAVDSAALTFTNGLIRAGAARAGVDGVDPARLWPRIVRTATTGLPSAPICVDSGPFSFCDAPRSGGLGARIQCLDAAGALVSESSGDDGGHSGVFIPLSGHPYWASQKPAGAATGGSGVTTTVQGTDGAPGAGALTDEGFLPGDGTAGTSGGPGAWGRGGRGQGPSERGTMGVRYWGRSGAGGGAGGCAGLSGTPGTGGGASVGVMALRSPLRLVSMTIESGAGGAAGKGTFGSPASSGLRGGDDHGSSVPLPTSPGSFDGEAGGVAGVSGNGAAGPSYGVVHRGGAPVLVAVQVKNGVGGAGVPARSVGAKTLAATPAGEAEGVKALP
ncbi:MAG: hypothetical protein IPQ09_19225 [Myxococcales bacterium]|nr:hypothetical protein [Myxococcales bacterium]HQY61305.1 hypothetical protein [Polyangiaceae bacterium]